MVMNMETHTQYLAPRQFAQLTGISESTLAKLRMNGGGPEYAKIGRSVRYSREGGLAWMAEHKRRNTSEVVQQRRQKSRHPTAEAVEAPSE
jgi:predicted DNA-binding transcriptional regulator AlpA